MPRTLVFNVKNQTIQKDPNCDFTGLVADTVGYLNARFTFSEDWNGFTKVVGFFANNGEKEFEPKKLGIDNNCEIPDEATQYHEFEIRVFGKRGGSVITTRPITIKQYGGIR